MTVAENQKQLGIDKQFLKQAIEELNGLMGFVPAPGATAEKAQEMTRSLGVRPEDNIGSCGIIAARDEE